MEIIIDIKESTIKKLINGIAEKIKESRNMDERLYNQSDISKILGISTRTLNRKNIPCYKTDKKTGRKYYSLPVIKDYLKA